MMAGVILAVSVLMSAAIGEIIVWFVRYMTLG